MFTDISERRQAQQLLAWEKGALELIADQTTLGPVLDGLIVGLEKCFPGALCAVLLLDDDGLHLCHVAAPSLPEAYHHLLDGIAIGPAAGPCVAAVSAGRQIIVCDIATDPLWADHREAALALGLRACWSTPIQGTMGKILGTLAIHYRQPRQPGSIEVEAMERGMRIASVAIERKKAEERLAAYQSSLREANEKLRLSNEELESRVVVRTSQLRVLLFRAAHELLFNVHRHAQVREALLVLDNLPDGAVRLVVSDAGTGFDPAAVRAGEGVGGGFGLFSLRERVEALEGSLQVDGALGRGTRVTVTVPRPADR